MWGRRSRRERIEGLEQQIAFLRGRNDEQAQTIAELDARNERVHADLKAMRERLPRMASTDPDYPYSAANLLADPDPTRSYIPTYEEEQR